MRNIVAIKIIQLLKESKLNLLIFYIVKKKVALSFGSVIFYSYICVVERATGRYGNIERVDSDTHIHQRHKNNLKKVTKKFGSSDFFTIFVLSN